MDLEQVPVEALVFEVVLNRCLRIESIRRNMLRNCHFFLVLSTIIILLHFGKADIRKDCRRESKVSWAALRRMKAGDLEQEDQNLKCYLKCFMMRHGILDKNAEVDVQRALRHLPRSMQDSSKKLFNKCKSVQSDDPCDKAYKMIKCYVEYHPEILQSVPFL
ncbi:general odorant-binding protein 56a-like isoform X2 [Bombus affinis]|uniref:General odorant-binding protein 56a isoform X2 n=1 Tax=Bombus terrestris TaxID=30195 RepID=A0A9C6SN06_BOMTE|nr:general odorant-binding protein 56a isoform X2 [Bombus terrestris]XP_050594670.1 general odorant-binding protein 56a-like isoform X2 [Bombus affinis]